MVKNIVNADIFSNGIQETEKLIVIDKFEDAETVINTSNELLGDIDSAEVVLLTTCVMKKW